MYKMIKNYFLATLWVMICLTGFSQSEIKTTTILKLTIYKGDAYKNWYKYSVGNDRKIREHKADLLKATTDQEKKTIGAILKYRLDIKRKADRKEKKAVETHSLEIPISLVFSKNNSNELPWKSQSIKLENNGFIEDSYFRIQITDMETKDYTSQNTFTFKAIIVNKHVLYPNLNNEMVNDVVDLVFSITINYENGKFDSIPTCIWSGGSVYKNKEPRIYKTDNKLYSFIPFLDRFEEDMIKNVQAVLQ